MAGVRSVSSCFARDCSKCRLIDEGLEATIKLQAPFGAAKDDISVTTSGDTLLVTDRRQAEPLLKILQLRSPIKANLTSWEISDNQVC